MMVSRPGIALDFIRFFTSSLVFAIYYSGWVLLCKVNKIIDSVFGRQTSCEYSAQIGRVILRRKLSMLSRCVPSDFLCLYYSHIDPQYVLKDNVSLYCVTKEEAIFVETPKHIDVFNSDESPFLFMAQFNKSRNIIRMPVETLHTLASKVGDPLVPVIWISNTGRCGSTLLCQIFEAVPGTLSLSEPNCPSNITNMHKFNEITDAECDRLFQSVVRVLCKPHGSTNMICIKASPNPIPLMSNIVTFFPTFKHIFLYRNCLDSVSSWLGLMTSMPSAVVLRACIDNEQFSSLMPSARNPFINMFIFKYDKSASVSMKTNTAGLITHMWANYLCIARDVLSRDDKILRITFEKVSSDPWNVCEKVFENFQLDPKYLQNAMTALSKDSQRGSILSKSRVGNDPRRIISVADRLNVNDILSIYKLSHMMENVDILDPCLSEQLRSDVV